MLQLVDRRVIVGEEDPARGGIDVAGWAAAIVESWKKCEREGLRPEVMPDILARRHAPALAHFASSNVLLAFDYDGTLAPITAHPERARIRERTRRLLVAAAIRYPCIVIGRGWSDVAARLDGIPLWHVYGNHGLEPWAQNAAHAATVRQWVDRLGCLRVYPGLAIEDKTYSVAIHYRLVRRKRGVRRAIAGGGAAPAWRAHRRRKAGGEPGAGIGSRQRRRPRAHTQGARL